MIIILVVCYYNGCVCLLFTVTTCILFTVTISAVIYLLFVYYLLLSVYCLLLTVYYLLLPLVTGEYWCLLIHVAMVIGNSIKFLYKTICIEFLLPLKLEKFTEHPQPLQYNNLFFNIKASSNQLVKFMNNDFDSSVVLYYILMS